MLSKELELLQIALILLLSVLLTWDEVDEEHLNWRQHSHVAEVWLLKQDTAEKP